LVQMVHYRKTVQNGASGAMHHTMHQVMHHVCTNVENRAV
jgi:hypothetical protein